MPQAVPAGLLPVAKHWVVPVVQESAALCSSQGLLGLHAVPVRQPTHAPEASQTLEVPQLVPVALLPLAKHWGVPVVQEIAVVWSWQRLLGSQAVPVVQATQFPTLSQTLPVPQLPQVPTQRPPVQVPL